MGLVKLSGVKKSISTMDGEAFYIGTEIERKDGRWDDSWSVSRGEWVIHDGNEHHIYVRKGHNLLR